MPDLKRQNGSIYWDVRGSGEPIVLLRGLGRTVRHWLGYDEELAKTMRVVTLDLRGVGKSTQAHGWSDSLFDLADDVVDVLTAAKIERAHIMGVSLGGMVALATGLKYPERCLSLITVNTSIAGQRTLRMSVPGFLGIAQGLVAGEERLHAILAKAMVGRATSAAEIARIAAQYAAIAADDGLYPGTVARQLLAAARFHVAKKLKKCELPALVAYGSDDVFVPNVNSRKLVKHLPRGRLVTIEGGGHEPTLDKAAELTQLVRSWVAEQAKPAR